MTDGDEERTHPRERLVDPTEWGNSPGALWLPVEDRRALRLTVAAYWQHLAVCALREKYPTRTAEELAERLEVTGLTFLKRQVSGEYRASIEELVVWAIAVGDVTLLPDFHSAEDLYPPGTQPLA